ncbi:aldehyde dehydrogenase family protein, partial [Escherichia coli]|nr:aldehyde dehydrogenase family protein [Escherichia coli]
ADVRKLKNYINGEWVESRADKYEDVINPATGEVLCQVPISTRAELEQAAGIAEQAFEKWSQVAVPRRARVLFSFQ